MSVIGKWALQGVVVFVFAWLATVAAQWSASVVRSTSSERLASLSSVRLSTESASSDVSKTAGRDKVVVGALAESNE